MKPCRHRCDINADTCGCTSDDLIHGGRVRLATCDICPYVEAPGIRGLGDVVERGLATVGITKERMKKVRGRDCGCADRQKSLNKLVPIGSPGVQTPRQVKQVNRSVLLDETPRTVVWVYWAGGTSTDELRYSMRSVIKNLSGVQNLVVCGNRPKWWKGDFIYSKKFTGKLARRKYGSTRFCKWCDSIRKLQKIIASDLVTGDFLWMYDDTFIMKPLTFQQIAIPRAGGSLSVSNRPKGHTWREVYRRTGVGLKTAGLPYRNYSTHYPAVYNKELLRQTIREFKLPENPRLIESLYMNHHYRDPAGTKSVFQYTRRCKKGWTPRNVPVINIGQFHKPARDVIKPLFPEATELELKVAK